MKKQNCTNLIFLFIVNIVDNGRYLALWPFSEKSLESQGNVQQRSEVVCCPTCLSQEV